MDRYFSLYELEQQDKSFINRVVYGTVENKIKLDYIINQFSKVSTDKLKMTVLILFRMSIYQMMYMDSVPDSAVIDEAVKLIKKRKMLNLSGFLNGVLRNISRNIDKIEYPKNKDAHYLSVMFSFPLWLIDYLLLQYPFEAVEEICASSLKPSPLCVRHNGLKGTKESLLQQLQKENIGVKPGHLLPYAYYLEGISALKNIKSFQLGLFQVQDESSMLIGEIANPKETDVVLDVCAAPGGKTTHLADLMHNKGKIISRDISQRKLLLIEENLKRLGVLNVELSLQDGSVLDDRQINRFDLVITDVPCSGLGIIQRKPDIKYNVSEDGLKSLIQLQRKILETSSEYVKAEGTLIYSTCTLNQKENEENVRWFLETHTNFEIVPLVYDFPNQYNTINNEGFLQLLPIKETTDGFFIAKLRRMA
ncbi:MAG: 16S rRNA (cytosine(967)-C(5))-methyltransferase RsmB [Vallitaleaceae bacterium]|nr:16S rRNA (cytosine(967)-C(5))-methyltransferase RsmB [Vallitaleaceae bacterium]